MNKPKHTPGPWKRLSNGMVNTKSGLIAAVYAGDSYLENRPDNQGVMDANAALIAEAPELLRLVAQFREAVLYGYTKDQNRREARLAHLCDEAEEVLAAAGFQP